MQSLDKTKPCSDTFAPIAAHHAQSGSANQTLPEVSLSVLMNVLDSSRVAALLIDQSLHCLVCTQAAQQNHTLQKLFKLQENKLIWLIDPFRFRRMVNQLAASTFDIEDPNGTYSWRLKAEPLKVKGRGRLLLLILEYIEQRSVAPSADWMISQLHLTPKEAKLAAELANGASTNTYASAAGLSIHTVRNQLKSIFGKLDVHSQKDLVSHLTRYQTQFGNT